MEGVHLVSDLIYKALEEIVDCISDRLTMIDDGVDEAEKVVREGAVGWLVGVEEEMRDFHTETGLE